MSVERWLSIEDLKGFALVQDFESREWTWTPVCVVDYDADKLRWIVEVGGQVWEIPRIRLYLLYEDPGQYSKRILFAVEQRNYAENYLRYSYLSRLVDVGEYFEMIESTRDRLIERSSPDVFEAFNAVYRRFHIGLSMNVCLEQNEWLNIQPVHMVCYKSLPFCVDELRALYSLGERFALIKRIILLSHPAVYNALRLVHYECDVVREMSLFVTEFPEPQTLAAFKEANEEQLGKVMQYLQNAWIERTTMQVHKSLLNVGRGWFNISITSWTIYQFMKLYRLVEQIKHRMQAALRDLVLTSTDVFCHRLCDPCELTLPIDENYSWEGSLIESPFESGKTPVFYLLLHMGEQAPYFSTDPDEFLPCLETLFVEFVEQTHDVHLIDPSLFGSLIFAPNLFLSSMGLRDPTIWGRRDHLRMSYRQCVIPLKAYATRYTEFKTLFFTNITEYVEEVKSTKTSLQVKEEISLQIRMRESLERTLPLSIVIGSFWIDVLPLRTALIQKRADLTAALLKMLTERLRDKTSDIVFDYNEIIERMCEKPASIEHIYEIREFMDTIPELLQQLEERMKTVVFEYEILDHFRYALPDADFYQKWTALGMPKAILNQIESVHEFHEGEVDKFRKQQVSDEAGFASRVEEINVHISKFTTVYDVAKVTEVSIEVKKLWKTINELFQYGETLNKRQELFEMAAIDLSSLVELKESFVGYKNMWIFAAEYSNVEESWRKNPISSVETEVVARTLFHYKKCFGDLLDPFEDQPQIQNVIRTFLARVEQFEPHIAIIELLQHPLLEPIHWNQLAKAAGIKVKLSVAANFELFLENHIEQHSELLRDIIAKAEEQKEELERIKAAEEEERRKVEEFNKNRELRRLKRTEI
ncbi:dynein heavy chain 1, axonemal [Culex quinquefasciatus]|nr:dynein heavy chain 1, axonemal [Culex quinquefasciatus]